MQKMFNIYKEEGEEFTESAKLRELFKQVLHPQLQDTVKALKVRFDMEGITYTQAANHLTAVVSELPEYHLTHKVSASSSGTPRIRGSGAATIIVTLRGGGGGGGGGCKPQAKAFLCLTDRFSQGITRTGQNYQKKTSSACWIHEARRRREVLAISDKFQT